MQNSNLSVFICSLLRQNVYGFLDEEDAEEEDHGFSYKQMEARDQRRWSMADLDHSGELDIQVHNTSLRYFLQAMLTKMFFQEFAAFLHPEDAEHMRDIVVQETLEDIDKDGDGHVRMPTKYFHLESENVMLCRLTSTNTSEICTGMRVERRENMVMC